MPKKNAYEDKKPLLKESQQNDLNLKGNWYRLKRIFKKKVNDPNITVAKVSCIYKKWQFFCLVNFILLVILIVIAFMINISIPKKSYYGQRCFNDTDCVQNLNLTCTNGKCKCYNGMYYSNYSTGCVTDLNYLSQCTDNSQCQYGLYCAYYSLTNSSVCQCSNNRYWNSTGQTCALTASYGDSCSSTTQCNANLICSPTSLTCTCPSTTNYFWNSNYCIPVQGYMSTCTSSSMCNSTQNLVCTLIGQTTQLCTCPSYYYFDFTSSKCLAQLTNGASCTSVSQCLSGSNLICSTTCQCPSNFYWSAPGQYCIQKASYGNACTTCDNTLQLTCGPNNYCICSGSLFWNGSNCISPIKIGLSCLNSYSCDSSLQLTCNTTTNQCVCIAGYYWNSISQTCTTQLVNGISCTSDLQCQYLNGLYCNTTIGSCSCSSQYYWSGTACALKKTVNSACTNSIQCQDYNLLSCVQNFCECTSQIHYWNSTTCVNKFSYGVACTVDGQCRDDLGLICADTCICTQGFYWSGSTCTAKVSFNIACNYTNQCIDYRGLVCITGKCLCMPSMYWSTTGVNQCVSKVSNGASCVTAQCMDYAGLTCQSNTCQCTSPAYWVTNKCQNPVGLNQYCDNVVYKCSSQFTCSSSSTSIPGICGCPSNQYWTGTACANFLTYGQSCNGWNLPCNTALGLICNSTATGCNCPNNLSAYQCDCPLTMYWSSGSGRCVARSSTQGSSCSNNYECNFVYTQLTCYNSRCECSPYTSYYWSKLSNSCRLCATGFTTISYSVSYYPYVCYAIASTTTDWFTASNVCLSKSSTTVFPNIQLLMVRNSNEYEIAKSFANSYGNLWVNAVNYGSSSSYYWRDGTSVSSFYCSGAPSSNGYLSFQQSGQCLADRGYTNSFYVVCQYGDINF